MNSNSILQLATNEVVGSSFMRPKLLILGLVFIFPIIVASVGGGSLTLILLLLLGLIYGRGWSQLYDWERKFLLGFVILFSIMCLTLVNTEDMTSGLSRLDRYLRIVAIIPIYLMLRRFNLDTGKIFLLGAVIASFVLGVQAWYQVQMLDRIVATGAYHKIVYLSLQPYSMELYHIHSDNLA